LERAVGAPPERRLQPILVRLVEVEPLGLLAGVALRAGMGSIAAHARDATALGLDLDTAVDAAEDAGRLPPPGARARRLHPRSPRFFERTRQFNERMHWAWSQNQAPPPRVRPSRARTWLRSRRAGSGRCGCPGR